MLIRQYSEEDKQQLLKNPVDFLNKEAAEFREMTLMISQQKAKRIADEFSDIITFYIDVIRMQSEELHCMYMLLVVVALIKEELGDVLPQHVEAILNGIDAKITATYEATMETKQRYGFRV